jgi:hypothetical protein
MKYAVISCKNGNFKIEAEKNNDFQGAVVFYHTLCASLWNAPDVQKAVVQIVDENMLVVNDFTETIQPVVVEETNS